MSKITPYAIARYVRKKFGEDFNINIVCMKKNDDDTAIVRIKKK